MDQTEQPDGPITLIKKSVGRRLRELREARHLSTAQFAQETDMAESLIKSIEQGRDRLAPEEMVRIAKKYGLTVGYFMIAD